MNRSEYLNDEHVAGFVVWLRRVIVDDRGFTQSYFPRNGVGINEIVLNSFSQAVRAYDFEGRDIGATQILLDGLAENIQPIIQQGNVNVGFEQQHSLLTACLKTLVWGGVTVRSTVNWLAVRAEEGNLHNAIRVGSNALVADNDDDLEAFIDVQFLRSDSAATKIYAMANQHSVIYDNRVGAALAKLVCEYLDYCGVDLLPETLAFMVDRGKERRDPSGVNRTFTRKTTGYSHAFWNQRTNWMLKALVQYDDVVQSMQEFEGVNTLRTLEAALFVMGGDIRNLTVTPGIHAEPVRGGEAPIGQLYDIIPEYINGEQVHCYCVPTGHNFGASIGIFHEFRQQNPGSDDRMAVSDFISFTMNVLPNAAIAYRSPLMPSHFNLVEATDELVSSLAEDPLGDDAFNWLQHQWQRHPLRKILVCTWVVGHMFRQDLMNPVVQREALVDRGLAGVPGSANVMIQVGRSFGSYFGLLDENCAPTDRFVMLFD